MAAAGGGTQVIEPPSLNRDGCRRLRWRRVVVDAALRIQVSVAHLTARARLSAEGRRGVQNERAITDRAHATSGLPAHRPHDAGPAADLVIVTSWATPGPLFLTVTRDNSIGSPAVYGLAVWCLLHHQARASDK